LVRAEQFAVVAGLFDAIQSPSLVLALCYAESAAIGTAKESLGFLDLRPSTISTRDKSLLQLDTLFFLPTLVVLLLLVPKPILFAFYVLLERSK
jgi:hypothetical protein